MLGPQAAARGPQRQERGGIILGEGSKVMALTPPIGIRVSAVRSLCGFRDAVPRKLIFMHQLAGTEMVIDGDNSH